MPEILSENRDLKAQVEETESMLSENDIERMPSFAIGFERGEVRGEMRGEARIVRRLLKRLDVTEVSDLLGLSPEEVERIASAGADVDLACDVQRDVFRVCLIRALGLRPATR